MPPLVATKMLNSQKKTAKVMQQLGTNLTAQDVVAVIDKQVRQPNTHRTGSVSYGLLHFLSTVSSAYINRLVMKLLSRSSVFLSTQRTIKKALYNECFQQTITKQAIRSQTINGCKTIVICTVT
jgi:hypothetical protein